MTTIIDPEGRRRLFGGGDPHDGQALPPDAGGSGRPARFGVQEPNPLARTLAAVTGILLVPLLGLHAGTVLVHPELDTGWLLARWQHPVWLFADWSLLVLSSIHATAALSVRLELFPGRGARARGPLALGTARSALVAATGAGLGLLVVLVSWAMLQVV